MLYDRSFLEPGQPWPPPSEAARLRRYEANANLFNSRPELVYGRWVEVLRNGAIEQIHDAVGFWGRLSWLWSSLVAGEAPEISASDENSQEIIDRIIADNRLITTLREVIVDASRYGDGLLRLRLEDGGAVIEGQSPRYWFPVVSRANIRNIRYHVIAYEMEQMGRSGGRPARYLRVEIHSAGVVEHRLYRLTGEGYIGQRITSPESIVGDEWPSGANADGIEETGVAGTLVIHAPGRRTTEDLYGCDDYTPIDSAMEKLLWIMSMRMAVIDKHTDPVMSGPPPATVTLDDGREVVSGGGRYYPVHDSDDPRPAYHVYDPNAELSFEHEKRLWEHVYRDSETSPTAFGHSESGYAESGSSLRLRMIAPLRKAEDLAEALEGPLESALVTAAALEGSDIERPSIEWRDGLPSDEREASQISAADVEAGITSRKTEMMRRFGYTSERADEELMRIAEESRGAEDPIAALERQLNPERR